MAEIKDPRGKLLLGEAVRLLVQSGASGVAITDFINEYSEIIKSALVEQQPPVSDLKNQMKEAVREVLHELAPPARRSGPEKRRRIQVLVDGTRTSLTLHASLLAKTVEILGTNKQARQLVNELANSKPADHPNRSAWVEEQLKHHLLLVRAEAATKTAH